MGKNDYQNFKRELASKKQVSFIKLYKFRYIGPYLRREFIGPRNVKIENDSVYFDVEDWATFKDTTVTVKVSEIELVRF